MLGIGSQFIPPHSLTTVAVVETIQVAELTHHTLPSWTITRSQLNCTSIVTLKIIGIFAGWLDNALSCPIPKHIAVLCFIR